MPKTVIALFDNIGQAQDAADALRAAGYMNDRLQVEDGEQFVRRGELPPPAHEQNLWDGIKRFFDEVGLTTPGAEDADDEHRPIESDDGIVMLETSDERADAAADMLDRAGALSIEERKRWRDDGVPRHQAMGLEPETAGRTPPDLDEGVNQEPGDVDERSLAGGSARPARAHRARIYGSSGPDTLARH